MYFSPFFPVCPLTLSLITACHALTQVPPLLSVSHCLWLLLSIHTKGLESLDDSSCSLRDAHFWLTCHNYLNKLIKGCAYTAHTLCQLSSPLRLLIRQLLSALWFTKHAKIDCLKIPLGYTWVNLLLDALIALLVMWCSLVHWLGKCWHEILIPFYRIHLGYFLLLRSGWVIGSSFLVRDTSVKRICTNLSLDQCLFDQHIIVSVLISAGGV